MTEIRNLLPIGSVVLLKNGVKKAMVIGVLQSAINKEGEITDYDYIGAMYPEGFFDVKSLFFFNHDQINDVIFRGYENPERDEFVNSLEKNFDKITELLRERLSQAEAEGQNN